MRSSASRPGRGRSSPPPSPECVCSPRPARAEPAPMPRTPPGVVPVTVASAVEIDKALIAEIKGKSEIMKNLQYLSERLIGPR